MNTHVLQQNEWDDQTPNKILGAAQYIAHNIVMQASKEQAGAIFIVLQQHPPFQSGSDWARAQDDMADSLFGFLSFYGMWTRGPWNITPGMCT